MGVEINMYMIRLRRIGDNSKRHRKSWSAVGYFKNHLSHSIGRCHELRATWVGGNYIADPTIDNSPETVRRRKLEKLERLYGNYVVEEMIVENGGVPYASSTPVMEWVKNNGWPSK